MAEIEQLNEEIRTLVRERQDLRTRGADRTELEQNRRLIVSRQWRLAHAFSAHYTPHPPDAAAA